MTESTPATAAIALLGALVLAHQAVRGLTALSRLHRNLRQGRLVPHG